MVASCRRMKADKGFSKKSTSPTRMFDASAPFGIFFMKALFTCISKAGISKLFNLKEYIDTNRIESYLMIFHVVV